MDKSKVCPRRAHEEPGSSTPEANAILTSWRTNPPEWIYGNYYSLRTFIRKVIHPFLPFSEDEQNLHSQAI